MRRKRLFASSRQQNDGGNVGARATETEAQRAVLAPALAGLVLKDINLLFNYLRQATLLDGGVRKCAQVRRTRSEEHTRDASAYERHTRV